MTTNAIISSFKENIVWIIITAFFTLIPFYYNTNSTISYINEKIEVEHTKNELNTLAIQDLNSNQLVQQERFKNIEKRLDNIEKKLDYLIEQNR